MTVLSQQHLQTVKQSPSSASEKTNYQLNISFNMNYQEFTKRQHIRTYTTYIRRNGTGYRLYKGVEITEADFQQATAMPERPYISVDNPCKKYRYLNIEGNVLDNLNASIQ